ncbi:MAG: lysophospholipid acyltransferase family protein [Halioglobus sp.]|nr:lysophospholipid acyltransferase family protein [Halioglobus sp.]
MPEFYLIPKRLARKAPILAAATQRVEAAVFRSIFWLMSKLSIEHALRLSAFAFGLVGSVSDKAAKARENLAIAFPDKSPEWREQTTRQIFRHLGYSAAELLKLEQIWEQREQRIEFVLEPEALKHMQSKRPTVFMTAHVGAWQVAALVTRQFGFTINTIYAPESNPIMQELMLGLRRSFGEQLIPADAGPRPLLKALNAGESIIMAIDTRPDTGKLIPFFGVDALTNTSAVGLALRTDAAIVVSRAERLPGGRYRITVYDPLVSPIPDAPVKDQAVAVTEIVHRHFEDWIREYPEQWVCLKRRWPKAHKL